MKHSFLNNLFSGILILILGFGLISCNENSTDADEEAALMYDGEEFTLGWGEIYDYGEYSDGYRNYDFIIFETQEDMASEEYNSNHGVYMWLESYGASSFDPGTYVVSDTSIDDNYIEEAEIGFFSADSSGTEEYYVATSGEVEVSISGSTFTLDFDLTFENDKTLTGSFSYDFEIYDDSSDGEAKASTNNTKPNRFK